METRETVSDSQYEVARRAWQAFREPTPPALETLRHEDTSALPYLAAAVTRFLQEYPWTTDGLSQSERRLLDLTSGDGIPLWKAFPRMGEGERAYRITDFSLPSMAETLSRTSPPLLALGLTDAARDHILQGVVTLTDTGRSVLAGQLDRVAACGIDRWLGGVHLQSGSPVWRWDETRQRVALA